MALAAALSTVRARVQTRGISRGERGVNGNGDHGGAGGEQSGRTVLDAIFSDGSDDSDFDASGTSGEEDEDGRREDAGDDGEEEGALEKVRNYVFSNSELERIFSNFYLYSNFFQTF